MVLTERQKDALTELINVAFARTGSALSDLAGNRVRLERPEVEVIPTRDLCPTLSRFIPVEAASIHQVFSGPVSGDAILLLNYEGAVELASLLTDGRPHPNRLDESDREALTEVGNILLNACLGMFGILLDVHVSFSVPHLHLATVNELLVSLSVDGDLRQFALIVFTAFQVQESEVQGYLVLVLSVDSLERLIHEVEAWEAKQEKS